MKQVYAVVQYHMGEPLLAFKNRDEAVEFAKRLHHIDEYAKSEKADDYVFALPLVTE